MQRITWMFLLGFALFSCGTEPPSAPVIPVQEVALSTESRVVVKRIATFRDMYAYSGKREILLITDTKTGKEYIGISGVDITETHEQMVGKVIEQIEE